MVGSDLGRPMVSGVLKWHARMHGTLPFTSQHFTCFHTYQDASSPWSSVSVTSILDETAAREMKAVCNEEGARKGGGGKLTNATINSDSKHTTMYTSRRKEK